MLLLGPEAGTPPLGVSHTVLPRRQRVSQPPSITEKTVWAPRGSKLELAGGRVRNQYPDPARWGSTTV